ncbi:MAG TPA: DUF3800 domain-containing protein [Mycobacteriales bacterium]|nr:DUF3800 domain-containing protein [Mycobacteriales bacterium]
MHICYVDESGGSEPPNSPISGVTPAMVIMGLVLPSRLVPAFTREFLDLKRRHFPKRFETGPGLSHILQEVKGSEFLQRTRSDSRNRRRHARQVRNDLVDLLETYDGRIIGRVWIKEPAQGLDQKATYCYAVQDIARHFSAYCVSQGSDGLMICDAREQKQNVNAAHSVFTDKFRTGGDPIPALVEAPVFAHSDNHAGLQACDLIASTMIFPMAVATYCGSTAVGAHASPRYAAVRAEIGTRLRTRQFMYRDENGKMKGGVVVSDKLAHRSSAEMFKP